MLQALKTGLFLVLVSQQRTAPQFVRQRLPSGKTDCETQMVARRNQQLAYAFTANDKPVSGHEMNKCFDNFASQANRLGILSPPPLSLSLY